MMAKPKTKSKRKTKSEDMDTFGLVACIANVCVGIALSTLGLSMSISDSIKRKKSKN